MLAKPTTKNFIQINSAPLKLRRELQGINYLTTLEIEHAIIMTTGNQQSVVDHLLKDGYTEDEVLLALRNATKNTVLKNGDKLSIREDRKSVVRKYCLLDVIANYGAPLPSDKTGGFLIVPGYSTYWGMPQAEVIKRALSVAPTLKELWISVADAFDDIQWLLEKGFVKSR